MTGSRSCTKLPLDIIEFDGLTHSLPPSLMADPRTNTSNVLCFLDVPAPSPKWSHKDRQKHYYTLSWYITQRDRPTNNDTIHSIDRFTDLLKALQLVTSQAPPLLILNDSV
ncbi:hypothetical protein ASPTUDRAFT_29935 [Aspergillus tubingensis CBS 134.48]|uniref:Uncharacterized protein n=1 Tax=Aspergillus tubingensis (strain CBS 134.48) TaxID=767770 RepID=A0A1L9N3R2_ASPTC|nr:hypothetical protein ASPTUDRAFT_29935 [Aspergillus tubingensis CBS 134.48]